VRILVDMDGVLVDLVTPWLADYNRTYGDDLSHEDIGDYSFRGVPLRCSRRDLFALLARPGLFLEAPPFPGAIAAMRRLVDDGHDVAVVTSAPMQVAPDSARQKWLWCGEHLTDAGIPHGFVVTEDKWLVRGDVLVDDAPAQLDRFPSRTIGVRYPWNRESRADAWVASLGEVPDVLRRWTHGSMAGD
jgi:5'(3')-deoxyribonucleotidase